MEISADSYRKEEYERSRIGGSFDRLLHNLEMLKSLKRKLRAKTLINVRAMIRPSQINEERDIINFWSQYADTVMPQYILDLTQGNDPDVFRHSQKEGLIPRCAIPLKDMSVHYNGIVPTCGASQRQTGMPEGLVVGDIHSQSLREIWNAPLFRQYRIGHQRRLSHLTPICKGCSGG